jgi:hypothetical protein
MRLEKTMKVIVNHFLDPRIVLVPNAGSDKSWVWVAFDFSDNELVETVKNIQSFIIYFHIISCIIIMSMNNKSIAYFTLFCLVEFILLLHLHVSAYIYALKLFFLYKGTGTI